MSVSDRERSEGGRERCGDVLERRKTQDGARGGVTEYLIEVQAVAKAQSSQKRTTTRTSQNWIIKQE